MPKLLFAFSLLGAIGLYGCTNTPTHAPQNLSTGRDFTTLINDESNELKAIQSIFEHDELWTNSEIEVVSFNSILLLIGQTPTNQLKTQAEALVRQSVKSKKLHNEIRVAAPTNSLVYLSDVSLTSKVKAALMLTNNVDGSKVKVVTEDGEVFLLGVVNQQMAQQAVEAARNVAGVKRVIKVFEIVPN